MNKNPSVSERSPLKDTSRNFINNPAASKQLPPNSSLKKLQTQNQNQNQSQSQSQSQNLLLPPIISSKQLPSVSNNSKQLKDNSDESSLDKLYHTQKLTTSDKLPQLQGASTPKKDGYLPFLTRTFNASNVQYQSSNQNQNYNINNNNNNNNNSNSNNNNNNNNNNNTTTKKMTGAELAKWQHTWREILTRSHIYFEQGQNNERDKKKAVYAIKKLGATVDPFFSENVTIVISKRQFDKSGNYPLNDIFRIAVKKQLKVWSIQKFFRFLNHIGESIPDLDQCDNDLINNNVNAANTNNSNSNSNSNTNNNNNVNTVNTNLSNLLMNERMFGPSDRDPNVKRNDFKYFTHYYIYIYDITQKMRPVATREWKDKSYPRLHATTNGKTFFISESKSTSPINVLKRHQRRLQCLKDTADYREKIINCAYNNSNSTPSYSTRVYYKKVWERSYYSTHPNDNPYEKYQNLYNSLSSKEKLLFKDLFGNINNKNNDITNLEDSSIVEISSIDNLKNGNKKQKLTKNSNTQSNSLHEPIGNIEVKNIDNSNNNNNNNNKSKKVETNDNDNLADLISNHSDDIDKINNPLANKETVLESIENPKKRKMPQLTRTESHIPTTMTTRKDGKLLCEYGEIAASGIQASGITPSGTCSNGNNGLGPSKSQVINKFLINERKKIVVLTPTLKSNKDNKFKNINNSDKENLNPKQEILIADGTIPETEDQIMIDGKMNEDELSALRSVEIANSTNGNKNTKNCLINNEFPQKSIDNKNIKNGKSKSIYNETNVGNGKNNTNVNNSNTNNKGCNKAVNDIQEPSKCEMKPGYCENCRIKYSDFTEHVKTEKHRSFATNDLNFQEIDQLINAIRVHQY